VITKSKVYKSLSIIKNMQKIVSLEGIVGSGKTTQLQRLNNYFSPDSYVVPELNQHSVMKEAIEKWRQRVAGAEAFYFDLTDVTQLAIARARSQAEYLSQAKDKSWVFMDRGVYTAMVYECGQLSMREIEEINRTQGVIFPDICIILDCEVKKALRRVDIRRRQQGRYERRAIHETEKRLAQTRKLYRQLAREKSKSIKIIGSGCSEEIIFQRILEILSHD